MGLSLVPLIAQSEVNMNLPPPRIRFSPRVLPEEAVRTRSTTVVNVTLEGSEWAAGLGVDDATTQFWLSRTLNTPSTQLLGWQAVARSRVSVHRATPYTLSLQLGWFAEYDIAWLDEEVLVSVPYWATGIGCMATSAAGCTPAA